MLKELKNKFTLACLALAGLVLLLSPAQAVTVSSFELQDGTGMFDFGYFALQNIEYYNGELIMPLEKDTYKNIKIMSAETLENMREQFNTEVRSVASAQKPHYKVLNSRAAGKISVVDVLFDDEIAITFTVSRYKKDGKYIYRVRRPSDFIFRDKNFETELKSFIRDKAVFKDDELQK
ncbi:hypothetical protein Dip518_000130 [Parelusimicrobium proximum]|uniref:hypothetical protein n=1 Tax=Parelusimicrobium proximum TaxID=3228953 RepID=UPI003D16680E